MSIAVSLKPGADLDGFRSAARWLVARKIEPRTVSWSDMPGLFADLPLNNAPTLSLPRAASGMVAHIICHSDPERFALLYELIWRLTQGEARLCEIHSDPLIHRLERMEKSVRRDLHKMHAFVRFRKVEQDGDERFVSWFEPEHFIVEASAIFFVERFTSLDWAILTPKGSLHWDRARLTIGPPARAEDVPAGDAFEDGWRRYYESTFNPARLNPDLMRSHMAKKYWRNLPEAQSIAELIRRAPSRVREMMEREAQVPRKRDPQKAVEQMQDQAPHSLAALNRLIMRAAPMVQGGTRAVLGEGPLQPCLMLVGEQPGDMEDIEGRPFVGPAGKLLDRALQEAGIERKKVYVTNAVKHFKFEQRGKRRLHAKPNVGEVKHYRWWLKKELDLVRPQVVVALGATAILALKGKALPVGANRGPTEFDGQCGFITVHPSSLLRMQDERDRRDGFRRFVSDLRSASELGKDTCAARENSALAARNG
ncbi:MAG TPA: UdgX family uracil-DNA binding protein [Rhizomicrobium sp.]